MGTPLSTVRGWDFEASAEIPEMFPVLGKSQQENMEGVGPPFTPILGEGLRLCLSLLQRVDGQQVGAGYKACV